MDERKLWGLLLAGIIIGIWRASIAQYREWKAERDLLPHAVRNMGFWTDTRLLWGERVIAWGWWAFVSVILIGVAHVIGMFLGWWCYPYCPSN